MGCTIKRGVFGVGSGATSVVQAAHCLANDQKVAIKRIELEQCGATIEELQVSTHTQSNNHKNFVQSVHETPFLFFTFCHPFLTSPLSLSLC